MKTKRVHYKISKAKKDYIITRYKRGLNFLYSKKETKAIEDFNEVIKLHPSYVGAFFFRGLAFYYLGENKKALKDFDEVVKFEPDHAEAFFYRGLSFVRLKKEEKALKDFDEAVKLKPDYLGALFYRGGFSLFKCEYEIAKEDMTKVMEIASVPKDIVMKDCAQIFYYWVIGMESLSKGLLKSAIENFLKSADICQYYKCQDSVHILFSLAEIVQIDLNFREYLSGSEDLNFLRLGIKKIIFTLEKIEGSRNKEYRIHNSTIRRVVEFKHLYFSVLLKVLSFQEVNSSSVIKIGALLKKLNFKNSGQAIGKCRNFIVEMNKWKRKKKIKSVKDIPLQVQHELKKILNPNVNEVNDILTYQGSQQYSGNLALELVQMGNKIINEMGKNQKELLGGHKEIKKGIDKIVKIKKSAFTKELDKDSDLLKETHNTWRNDAKYSATQEEIDDFRDSMLLFVDGDKSLVYTNGKQIVALQKSPQGYKLLTCLLSHNGNATPKQILQDVFDDEEGKSSEKKKKQKGKIARAVGRLEDILESNNIGTIDNRGWGYHLESKDGDSIDFVMAEKKKRINL